MSDALPTLDTLKGELMHFALAFSEAHEDHPWGETVTKVRNKIFVFWGGAPTELAFSVKLPRSHGYALSLPYAKPTGYGLGKSGWVSFSIKDTDMIEPVLFKEWIDESYRAVAPKKLAALVNRTTIG